MKRLQKNIITAAVITSVVGIVIWGCTLRPTAGHLLTRMSEGYAEEESVLCNVKLSVKMNDGTEEMDISCDMDVEMTDAPEAAHYTGYVEMKIAGEGTGMEVEKYTVQEDKTVCYTGIDGKWNRRAGNEKDLSVSGVLFERLADLEREEASFEVVEEATDINGMECSRVSGEISTDILKGLSKQEIMKALRVGASIDDEIFYKENMKCTIDMYKESQLPARLTMDFTDAANKALVSEADGITITEYKADIVYVEYADVDEIEVPEEVINRLEQNEQKEDEDEAEEGQQDDSVSAQAEAANMTAAEQQDTLGETWDSYTVQIGENVLTFPCNASELSHIGWKQNGKYLPAEYQIGPGEREMVWYKDESGNSYCVDMINNTDAPLTADKCLAYGITVDAGHLGEDGASVVFPGDLQIGDTAYSLREKYGEPDEKREGNYISRWFWYGTEDGASGFYVDVDVESGKVDSVSMVRGE